ncbi:MAG: hypothetical protein AAF772_19950 [Acidobacteriota bacterium]
MTDDPHSDLQEPAVRAEAPAEPAADAAPQRGANRPAGDLPPWMIAMGLVVILLSLGFWWWTSQPTTPEPDTPPPAIATPDPGAASPPPATPTLEPPPEDDAWQLPPPPSRAEADGWLRTVIGEAFAPENADGSGGGSDAARTDISRWLGADRLIDRAVGAVNRVAVGESPATDLDMLASALLGERRGFRATPNPAVGDAFVISRDGYRRYDRVVGLQ